MKECVNFMLGVGYLSKQNHLDTLVWKETHLNILETLI